MAAGGGGPEFQFEPAGVAAFGVLAGFSSPKGKAAGRIVLGIAFIFLGIDQIKNGFGEFGSLLDLAGPRATAEHRELPESHARYLDEAALASVDTASRALPA